MGFTQRAVTKSELSEVARHCAEIRSYPNRRAVLRGSTSSGRILEFVADYRPNDDRLVVITVYEPTKELCRLQKSAVAQPLARIRHRQPEGRFTEALPATRES